MKQQTILKFLNLPGVVGVALMDGHSRPYFAGIDQALNFQQKEALTQGIQQVISTTPAGFDSFDFRFAQRNTWIYKLKNGVILLVVTDSQLDTLVYNDTVDQLKETLESDPHSAISTFRLVAGSTTLGGATGGGPSPPPAAIATAVAPAQASPLERAEVSPEGITWQDCLAALNALTDATAQYLGKIVVANTWRATRPQADNLSFLQVDRHGYFSLSAEGSNITENAPIEAAIYTTVQEWVSQFVRRCSMFIRDYVAMVIDQHLTDRQKAVLQADRLRQS